MFKYDNATPESIRNYAGKCHSLAEEYWCTIEEKNIKLLEFLDSDLTELFQSVRINRLYDEAIKENLEAIYKVKHNISDLVEKMHATGDILFKFADVLEVALSSCCSASMGDKLI